MATIVLSLLQPRHRRSGSARHLLRGCPGKTILRLPLLGLLALALVAPIRAAAQNPQPATGPELVVTLDDGRRIAGEWSTASDAHQLSLTLHRARVSLVRHIPWHRVQQVTSGGVLLDPAEMRLLLIEAQTAALEAESIPVPDVVAPSPTLPPNFSTGGPVARVTAHVRYPQKLRFAPLDQPLPADQGTTHLPSPRMASLTADAYLTNWDRDAEADGLVVFLQPLDADGQPVAVSGHAEFELLASRPGTLDPYAALPKIGHWSRRVSAAQITARGARFRLEFQGVLPDVRTDLEAYGSLLIRLVVPGQGTFDASLGTLRIRGYDLLRDRRQRLGQPRFFPGETPGRWQ